MELGWMGFMNVVRMKRCREIPGSMSTGSLSENAESAQACCCQPPPTVFALDSLASITWKANIVAVRSSTT